MSTLQEILNKPYFRFSLSEISTISVVIWSNPQTEIVLISVIDNLK